MWTNLLAAGSVLITVLIATVCSQWQLLQPTGRMDRDRTHLTRLLAERPCLFEGPARGRLGELCLQQAEGALRESDYAAAAEPLQYLLARRERRLPATGFEEEAERTLRRLPQDMLRAGREEREAGNYPAARRLFSQVPALFPFITAEVRREAAEAAQTCSLQEGEAFLKERNYEDAHTVLCALVAKPEVLPRVRDEAYRLIPEAVEEILREKLRQGQIQEALEVLTRAEQAVGNRPDVGNRLRNLQSWLWSQLFNEAVAPVSGSEDLPAVVYAGAAPAGTPGACLLRVHNQTGYPLRVALTRGTVGSRPQARTIARGAVSTLVLSPGTYWARASCPGRAEVRPHLGSMDLPEAGTFDQHFVLTR